MDDKKQLTDEEGGRLNLGRHESQCSICSHPQRLEIERAFVGWGHPTEIALQYRVSRDSLYRHAHALGLFKERQRNIRGALERLIECAGEVPLSASAVVSAIQTYIKMNRVEQGIEPVQGANFMKLLEQMSKEERETFARDRSLPKWFPRAIGATPSDGQEGEKES
jgi:hypothetical protein